MNRPAIEHDIALFSTIAEADGDAPIVVVNPDVLPKHSSNWLGARVTCTTRTA